MERLNIKDYIILGLIALFFCLWFFNRQDPIDYSGEILEMNQEIESVKSELLQVQENLKKRYEIIDTASVPTLRNLTNDLLKRSGSK